MRELNKNGRFSKRPFLFVSVILKSLKHFFNPERDSRNGKYGQQEECGSRSVLQYGGVNEEHDCKSEHHEPGNELQGPSLLLGEFPASQRDGEEIFRLKWTEEAA